MAMTAIASMVTSTKLTRKQQLAYTAMFIKEIASMDRHMAMYEKYATMRTLPNHIYGDATGITNTDALTNGSAARAANLYTTKLDSFAITAWDDLSYQMNYGFRLDDMGNGTSPFTPTNNYGTALDYNYRDFMIDEGTGYGNAGAGATNYRAHDKAITNKFEVNCPLIRFGATMQKDSLAPILYMTEDGKQIMKQFGKQANMVEAQYIRATLINEATQWAGLDYSADGAAKIADDAVLAGSVPSLITKIKAARQQLVLREAEMFAGSIKASDGVGTTPVQGGYVGVVHSLMEDFLEADPTWIPVHKYGSQVGLLPNEIGMFEGSRVRIVTNDLLVRDTAAQIAVGAAPAAGGMLGVSDAMFGSELGTYNMIIMGKDAYTIATLKGTQRHTIYVDEPGKGTDTLRLEANTGWKTLIGCKVHRKAYIHNIPIILAD